jgi:hypothetical protein
MQELLNSWRVLQGRQGGINIQSSRCAWSSPDSSWKNRSKRSPQILQVSLGASSMGTLEATG